MMKPRLSVAASGLLRAILARTGVERDRILICDWKSVDWQSLTFFGERHEAAFRVTGPGADHVVAMIADGLEDAEFTIPGQIVADIALAEAPVSQSDGSVLVAIEALTVGE
ncbi:MAG TPA: hypothetical protein VK485_08505 [Sphingomicrobium sp.]|nr:hypothetical protein [Sphingomicrobium sp.]